MFEITGTLKLKKEEAKVSDTFKKREFVLTDATSNYPQHILFQLTQERCRLLEDVNPGDEIKVGFFIRGREWQPKDGGDVRYFTSLDAWRLEKTNKDATTSSIQEPVAYTETPLPQADEKDDLPF